MKKAEAMARWEDLDADQPMLPHMTPIPYQTEGSRFGACGVRIDGNPAFVDAVLSHLKELLGGENNKTRLELSRNEVKPVEISGMHPKYWDNADRRAESCYIRLHERGGSRRSG